MMMVDVHWTKKRSVNRAVTHLLRFTFGFLAGLFFSNMGGYNGIFCDSPPRHAITNEPPKPDSNDYVTMESEYRQVNVILASKNYNLHTTVVYNQSVIRLFCIIMTGRENHERRARHVRNTWAQRCDKFVFISDLEDSELPAISLNTSTGRSWLWAKTKESLSYVYAKYGSRFDWFLKADDDTYVIVEHLRELLSKYHPSKKIWFGAHFDKILKQGYFSGGAGYVLSQEALATFVVGVLPQAYLCRAANNGCEDVELANCLSNAGVTFGDSRDAMQRHRFFPVPVDTLLGTGTDGCWYWNWFKHKCENEGPSCISSSAVTFHYTLPNNMYNLEYELYVLPFLTRSKQ